jgi:hypothetical protein
MKEGIEEVGSFREPLDVDDIIELFGIRTLRSV